MAELDKRPNWTIITPLGGAALALTVMFMCAASPSFSRLMAANVGPYRELWSFTKGATATLQGYEAALDACAQVSDHPEKYADDVVAACKPINVAVARNVEAVVRQKRADGSLQILTDKVNGNFNALTADIAIQLFQQHRNAALASLAK